MTSPAGTTTPLSLAPGAAPVPVTDGHNSPVGLQLVNRGDNGGTVWIMSGPAGQAAAVPLGPAASLQWTDQQTLPYAYVPAGGTAETLVITSQSVGYANPTAVAASLIAQGIPSTMLDTGYGTFRIPVAGSSVPIDVSRSASLIVTVQWPQLPNGCNVLVLTFTDPALPDFPPLKYYCTVDNAVEQGAQYLWRVPVVAPRLTLTNVRTPDANNGDAYCAVVGTNRQSAGFRQIGGELGLVMLGGTSPNLGAGALYPLPGYAGAAPLTRFVGTVTCIAQVQTSGLLSVQWVDERGSRVSVPFVLPTGNTMLTWAHPNVPVQWRWAPNAASSGAVWLTISQNNPP